MGHENVCWRAIELRFVGDSREFVVAGPFSRWHLLLDTLKGTAIVVSSASLRHAFGMQRTIVSLLEQAVHRYGERAFFGVGDRACTFSSFVLAVKGTACALRQRGLEAGDRVAVLLPRGEREAVFLLATMVAGGIAVPIHSKLKDDQVRHVLEDARPRLLVTNAERTVGLRDPGSLFAGQQVLEASIEPAGIPFAEWPECVSSDSAVLLYTSGSTGRAKGIEQTHGNLLRGAERVANFLSLDTSDHILALLSFSFDYGLNQLLTALLVGCRLSAADYLGVGELADLLEKHRPTGLAGVPSLWHEVAAGMASGALEPKCGASLRYITNSGGSLLPVDSDVIRRCWPRVSVYAMYGLTEAFRSAFLPPQEFDAHPDSFGYALEGVELLLASPEDGSILHGPAIGELVHAGELIAKGYWGRCADQALRFRKDPRNGRDGIVVYTGDLVRRDDCGRHYFLSRLDRMIKVQGHRISPDEVAQAVIGMDSIGEVCVIGIDGGADGQRIVMWLAGDPRDKAMVDSVRRRCRAKLPSYMLPSDVRVLTELPHNANGKIDEEALRRMLDT